MPYSVLGLFVAVVAVAVLGTYRLTVIASDCPLDLGWSNFSLAASVCSNHNERGKCCRYINAFVAVSVARYANTTGKLGVPSAFSQMCLNSVSQTLEQHGIPSDAMVFCGLGRKILITYQCEGRASILEMLQSPNFSDVIKNCKMPLSMENNCRRCLNSGIVYLHHLIGAEDNVTLSTCRDATFVALANQGDNMSSVDLASCFFGVQGLNILPVNISGPSESLTPEATPAPVSAKAPSQHLIDMSLKEHHHAYHLTLIPVLGIVVTGVAVILLIVLTLLIRRKNRELKGAGSATGTSWNGFTSPPVRKSLEGPPSMFRRFSYKETTKASNDFSSVIGRGGFGTVYKAQFGDGFVAAVKRMDKVSVQGEDEFCREMELLGRLHHRHLVSLKGYCVAKHERFLLYEYMENGSLKDNLHSSGKTPLSWQTRIQIAIDVANALEYLHFYCDPPLCHRDIKSSNILLDENFTAKVADFGLAHASRSGSISFEPVNTDIRGTPGYMDPEYVVTQELTEKSDIYSYGVLLLELVTGRLAIQDNRNLVEWSQKFMVNDSKLPEMVDPTIADAVNLEKLQVVVGIIQWCTQREGRARPSIKQVLRLLYEGLDPVHQGFAMVMEEEEEEEEGRYGGGRNSKGKSHKGEMIPHSGDARCLPSSSSTSRSYCSRSFLLESGSPQSPPNGLSI